MRRTKPLVRALSYVQDRIRVAAKGTHRLPVYRELALQAGVAPGTMLRALRVLRDSGVVSVSHGRGVTATVGEDVQPQGGTDLSNAEPHSLQDRLQRRIEDDIDSGRYLPGETLKPVKAMTRRYGVAYATLLKAFRACERRGVLDHGGKFFSVKGRSGVRPGMSIVLIAIGDDAGRLQFFTPRTQPVISAITSECLPRGLQIQVCAYNYQNGALAGSVRLDDPAAMASVAGAIILQTSISAPVVLSISKLFTSRGKPVALYDEDGDSYEHYGAAMGPHVRIFSNVGAESAGFDLGKALLERGHTTTAFLSCHHDATFSKRRLAGLQRAFREYGRGARVVPLVKVYRTPPSVDTRRDAITDAAVKLFVKRNNLSPDDAGYRYILDEIRGRMGIVLRRRDITESCRPLFEEAWSRNVVTAWVGANDSIALEALLYLRHQKSSRRKQILVAGFDDSSDALFYNFTSYNFNDIGASRAMISHVLAPPRNRASRRSMVQVVEGFVNVRSAVGVSSLKIG
jgi:DNA-binding LacI/PurR family transcriptional regulator/DNA-binding transcriptional regulator YhcF (GntR family)